MVVPIRLANSTWPGLLTARRGTRSFWPIAYAEVERLVARFIMTLAFGRRCIPPRGVARRSHAPGMLPPRALPGADAPLSPGPSVRHRHHETDHLASFL